MHKAFILTIIPLAAATLGTTPAQAREADHLSIHESASLCDSGVVVDYSEETDLHWIARPTPGPSDTSAFTVWTAGDASWNNPANGRTVTMTYTKACRDLTVADNGDGTRTIRTLNNRIEKYVGPDGERVMNRGPIWLEVVVADAGTPADMFDDYWVELLDVREAGNWDLGATWCDQMVDWLAP